MDRRAAPARTELRTGDLAAWPARPAEQPSKTEQLQNAAQKWVGQTFFGTMLKQMRNSPFKSEIFSGGRGGEAFTSMFDQQLAERMARGAGRSLSNSIVRQIERRDTWQGEGNAPPNLPGRAPVRSTGFSLHPQEQAEACTPNEGV